MAPSERESFIWLDHLKFPVINENGQTLPLNVVEEYMMGVTTPEQLEVALPKLLRHVILDSPSSRSLKRVMDDIKKALHDKKDNA